MEDKRTIELSIEELDFVTHGLRLLDKFFVQQAEDMPCTWWGDPIGDERSAADALRKKLMEDYRVLFEAKHADS